MWLHLGKNYGLLPAADYGLLPAADYDLLPAADYGLLPAADYDLFPAADYDLLPAAAGTLELPVEVSLFSFPIFSKARTHGWLLFEDDVALSVS